jgi:hypothetical protein
MLTSTAAARTQALNQAIADAKQEGDRKVADRAAEVEAARAQAARAQAARIRRQNPAAFQQAVEAVALPQ